MQNVIEVLVCFMLILQFYTIQNLNSNFLNLAKTKSNHPLIQNRIFLHFPQIIMNDNTYENTNNVLPTIQYVQHFLSKYMILTFLNRSKQLVTLKVREIIIIIIIIIIYTNIKGDWCILTPINKLKKKYLILL